MHRVSPGRARSVLFSALCAAVMALLLLPATTVASAAPVQKVNQPSKDGLVYKGLVKADRCGGGYKIRGTHQCTTGPEEIPDEGTSEPLPEAIPGDEIQGSGSDGVLDPNEPHAVPCFGDGATGPRLQAVYVVAEDRADRFADVVPIIRQAAGYADEVYSESAAQTGGVRHLRWVTDSDCLLDVKKAVISASADDTFAATREALRAQGFTGPERKYVMWVDAAVYCGIATVPHDDRGVVENAANLDVHFARIDTSCWNYVNSIEAHEIAHMLGAVQPASPHSNGSWHCTDDSDLMCYNDGSGATSAVCDASQEKFLDCNKDDYFNTSPSVGSYLDTNWNVADSVFLSDVDGEYPEMSVPETWSWSGSLSKKVPSMSHTETLDSGTTNGRLSFTKAKSMRLSVVNEQGVVVAVAQGSSPLTMSRFTTAGSWTFKVDGANNGSYLLTIDGWRA